MENVIGFSANDDERAGVEKYIEIWATENFLQFMDVLMLRYMQMQCMHESWFCIVR